jgi:hypothetical protein
MDMSVPQQSKRLIKNGFKEFVDQIELNESHAQGWFEAMQGESWMR